MFELVALMPMRHNSERVRGKIIENLVTVALCFFTWQINY